MQATRRTPSPFSVTLRRNDIVGGKRLLEQFGSADELTVYPLPGFHYTTDRDEAMAYFVGLRKFNFKA